MKLLAVDGNSILNRAYYGIPPLHNRDGFPTNAIHGFLSILQRLLDETSPDALCVCFDRKEKTFRHAAYPDYKGKREAMDEDLALQIPKLKEVLDAMNIPRFELPGWEADDLLGTIARLWEAEGGSSVLATGDKDLLQLITEKNYVYLVSSRRGQALTSEMDPGTFRAQYGFAPAQLIDLKALMGDASDNIPGVKGVGEKTGMDLVQRFGSIAQIYDKLDELDLKPAVRKRLQEGAAAAALSYELAAIHTDAPLELSQEALLRRPINQGVLYQLFLELEFHKLIEAWGLHAPQGNAPAPDCRFDGSCEMELVSEAARVDELLAHWRAADFVALLALPDLSALAVHCGTGEAARMSLLFRDKTENYDALLRALFSGEIALVGHHIKPLMRALLEGGYPAAGFCFDTALAAYLLAPTDGSYEIDHLAMQLFPMELSTPPAKAKAYLTADAFSPLADQTEALGAFASHCAWIAALYEELSPRLDELGLRRVYEEIELPLCRVLAEMELQGFLLDRAALLHFGEELKERITALQIEIHALAGGEFNINSTQQLGVILFETLKLPPVKRTKSGYSTSVEVLEKLRGEHPIIECVMEYRQLSKLNSTYVEGLTKLIAPDGRIHSVFQNTVTATGRLSSTEPNLQNIPVRTELGARMRDMFIAPPGSVLVDADYSQIELRLLAHIAGDEAMLEAFRRGGDFHRSTAAQVFGVPPAEVTAQMRSRAKAVNFGIVYGISEFSLAQDIGVTRREAGEYMERYFASFPGVRAYMHEVVKQAKQDGYVATLLGRRRWLPELKSSNYNLRAFGERVALNMPIQGTAADIMKLAMIRVHARLLREGLRARLVLQVHDELIVEAPESEAEAVRRLLEEEMAGVCALDLPLEVEASCGKSWGEAKG